MKLKDFSKMNKDLNQKLHAANERWQNAKREYWAMVNEGRQRIQELKDLNQSGDNLPDLVIKQKGELESLKMKLNLTQQEHEEYKKTVSKEYPIFFLIMIPCDQLTRSFCYLHRLIKYSRPLLKN